MQGRQDQVPGLGSFESDHCRFRIPDFPHHKHIRVLPEKGTCRIGKIQADGRIYGNLVDSFQVQFHRVLHTGDIALLGIEQVQSGVQGHGFAAAGRAGYQDQALLFFQGVLIKPFSGRR